MKKRRLKKGVKKSIIMGLILFYYYLIVSFNDLLKFNCILWVLIGFNLALLAVIDES